MNIKVVYQIYISGQTSCLKVCELQLTKKSSELQENQAKADTNARYPIV